MKTKPIPALTTLIAGLVISIIAIVNKYETEYALTILFGTMLCFFFIGLGLKAIADREFNSTKKKEPDVHKEETDSKESLEEISTEEQKEDKK